MITVDICPPEAITAEEKAVLEPGLEKRGLTSGLLDAITNIPNRTNVVKARDGGGRLLGLTTVLLTPRIFMKHCFGHGNHIGTNNTFFFAEDACKSDVLAAILKKLLSTRFCGYYVGFVEDDYAVDFREAIGRVPGVVGHRIMEAGCISTRNPLVEQQFLAEHKHLSRQVHRFANKGGKVDVCSGPVGRSLAGEFAECCSDSYSRHTHPGKPINIQSYTRYVCEFMSTFPDAVHFYASMQGRVVGVQTFIRHRRFLELTEGGFLADAQNYHAYENIMMAALRYARDNSLDRVSYGLIANPAKDRLMDKSSRSPIFLVMFFRHKLAAALFKPYRYRIHARFPMLYWKDRAGFGELPL